MAPVAAAFQRQYPGCTVELLLFDVRSDLVADHIDLSVRVGWLTDSSIQARRIGTFQQRLVGSPDLAAEVGKGPEAFAEAPFIANLGLRTPLDWTFTHATGETAHVPFTSGLTQRDLALAISVGERFIVELEGGKSTAQLGKALAAAKAVGLRLEDTSQHRRS